MSEGSPHGGECVLVVEDEEDAREMMRELIELGGCSAMLAANGADALEMLASHRPCLIVVDLLMPVMDGIELVEELRRRPELATIPVIIATSAPYRAPHGVPVLPKPIDVTSLWGWMRRTCRCARAEPATVAR
ncbi:MAG TPA: response regulator [Polyangiaceae bacterium]|nr:response regulator [Polyangiaceae bacterium]